MNSLARLAIEDYDRILETGIFQNRRIEFIEGIICELAPVGPKEESAVNQMTRWSYRAVDDSSVLIRVQNSLGLPLRESVPEPDLVWVQNGDYTETRPTADDAILVVEVADTSLDYDLGEKARRYAAAGIRDNWVVDCQNRRVIVHRQPSEAGYGSVKEFSGSKAISPLSHPHVTLLPEVLFRPTDAE